MRKKTRSEGLTAADPVEDLRPPEESECPWRRCGHLCPPPAARRHASGEGGRNGGRRRARATGGPPRRRARRRIRRKRDAWRSARLLSWAVPGLLVAAPRRRSSILLTTAHPLPYTRPRPRLPACCSCSPSCASSANACPQSVIILLQTAPSPASRTYLDFGAKGQAYDALIKMYEDRLKQMTPDAPRNRPAARCGRRRGPCA